MELAAKAIVARTRQSASLPNILFTARYAGDEGNGYCGRGILRDGSRHGPVCLRRPCLAAIRLLRTPRHNIRFFQIFCGSISSHRHE